MSNAADRSNKVRMETLPLSKASNSALEWLETGWGLVERYHSCRQTVV